MPQEYAKGDKVMAKWPRTNTYYPASIKNRDGKNYEVVFSEGTTYTISSQHIKSASSFRSRSPARAKKSPTRSRNSPSRVRKSPGTIRKKPSRSKSRSPSRKTITAEKLQPVEAVKVENGKSETVRQRLRLRSSDASEIVTLRTSARIAAQHLDHTVRTEELKPYNETDLEMDSKFSAKNLHNILTACMIFATIVLTPMFVMWIHLSCKNKGFIFDLSKVPKTLSHYWDWKTFLSYIGWIILQVVLASLPFGKTIQGQFLKDGTRLEYRLNGMINLVITIGITLAILYSGFSFDFVYNKFTCLIVSSTLVSHIITFCLYMKASHAPTNEIGNTGNFVIDYFMGRELNPRFRHLDLKLLFDGRLGILTWMALTVGFVWDDLIKFENIYSSLLLVAGFHLLYVLHFIWHEDSIITTWDFTNEGLGFMLVFGNLTFVPVIFTLPLQYLAIFRPQISVAYLVMLTLLYVLGYAILHGSNVQKGRFKRNHHQLKYSSFKMIESEKKEKLLIDGWWKWVRHPNYLGDLIVALAWSLPCGFTHVLPYTYLIYLLIILLHRTYRVENKCKRKYGTAWEIYCEHVKYKIIPYIF